jgi:hypothetical protein
MKKFVLLFTLAVVVLSLAPDSQAMEPIRIVFNIHDEPMTSIPIQNRYQAYLNRRAEDLWLCDTLAVLTGCKLGLKSNGEFMEYLHDEGDTVLVPHFLAGGHQIGTHVHSDIRLGPHNWLYVGGNCSLDTAAMVWEDNIAMVQLMITPQQNTVMESQVPNPHPQKYQFMVDFGFPITGGGPTEPLQIYFGHIPWNPSRPSAENFLIENVNQLDFIQVPHSPQIGVADWHGPQNARAFFDCTLPAMKVEFLKIYMEWLRHDRLNDDNRIWSFGWGTHDHVNYLYRSVELNLLQWLNDNFVGHTSPQGSLIAQYASFDDVAEAFWAWEAAHPGQSSFSYTPGNPYPYSYHGLVNLLAYNHHQEEINTWLPQGIHVHALADSSDHERWLLWKDNGQAIINFSSVYSQPLLSYDPISGQAANVSPTSVTVTEEPLLLAPVGSIPQFDVTLTPVNPPIFIPAQGGNFNFNASVVNIGPNQSPFSVWARMRLPNGVWTAPTLGPVTVNPPVNTTITRLRTQSIPGTYQSGMYRYVGYSALNYPGPVIDSSSFTFIKTVTVGGSPWIEEASCSGELFPGEELPSASVVSTFDLVSISPNPFNPTTIISYQLSAISHVSLRVYDTAGRLVATLVDGWQNAGTNGVYFDGSRLASGLYFVKMQAGDYCAVKKMMLVK